MANPMFQNPGTNGPAQNGGIFGMLFNRMYNSNPEFRDFANSMKGLSEEEMIRKCGVDPEEVEKAKKDPNGFLSQRGLM